MGWTHNQAPTSWAKPARATPLIDEFERELDRLLEEDMQSQQSQASQATPMHLAAEDQNNKNGRISEGATQTSNT